MFLYYKKPSLIDTINEKIDEFSGTKTEVSKRKMVQYQTNINYPISWRKRFYKNV
jgi:hypothetical protein